MASVHGLRTSIPARELCELLNDVEMRTEAATEAKRLLRSWDCRMDRDHPQPTIFSAFHDALAEAYSASILGPLAEEMAGETGRGAPSWYGRTKSSLHDKLKSASSSGEMTEVHSLLAGALETAVTKLKAWLGEEMSDWTWGRVHKTSPRHALSAAFPNLAQELNPPSVGTHGDGFTPLAGSYSARGAVHTHVGFHGPVRVRYVELGKLTLGRAPGSVRASGKPSLLRPVRDMGQRRPPTHALRLGSGLPAVRDPSVPVAGDRLENRLSRQAHFLLPAMRSGALKPALGVLRRPWDA